MGRTVGPREGAVGRKVTVAVGLCIETVGSISRLILTKIEKRRKKDYAVASLASLPNGRLRSGHFSWPSARCQGHRIGRVVDGRSWGGCC